MSGFTLPRIAALDDNTRNLRGRNHAFAMSLLSQYSRKGSLSPAQWPHVDRLASLKPKVRGPALPENAHPAHPMIDVSGLLAPFERAAEKIRWPKIVHQVERGTVKIQRAGSASRYPGSLNITDGRPFGDNTWYGRVDAKTGVWTLASNVPEWVQKQVIALAHDLRTMAGITGQLTGNCCFCNTHIETAESMAVGYGPVCAENFGLPWGEVSTELPEPIPAAVQESMNFEHTPEYARWSE